MGNSYSVTGDHNQVVQGNSNQVNFHNQENTSKKEQLTQAQVAELLAEVKHKLKQSALTETVKEEAVSRLVCATNDIKEKEPDKKTAASNLKKFAKTIEEASKTSEEAKKLLDNIQPIMIRISKWLGVGIAYLLGSL